MSFSGLCSTSVLPLVPKLHLNGSFAALFFVPSALSLDLLLLGLVNTVFHLCVAFLLLPSALSFDLLLLRELIDTASRLYVAFLLLAVCVQL